MIDIVEIKVAAKKRQIGFYAENNKLYCKDKQNGECVYLGDFYPSNSKDYISNMSVLYLRK